jgi:hypothetical protein
VQQRGARIGPATKDPVAGVVDLDYGTARFVVQYD